MCQRLIARARPKSQQEVGLDAFKTGQLKLGKHENVQESRRGNVQGGPRGKSRQAMYGIVLKGARKVKAF